MKYYTYITRKQIGVIFSNWKKGNLNFSEELISFLYNHCAEVRGFNNNNTFEDVLVRVKNGIEMIFNNDIENAEKEIISAFNLFNCSFSK